MTTWKTLLLGACAPLVFAACATAAPAPAPETAPAPVAEAAKPKYGTFGFDVAGMDTSVAPGDDFYAYANGGWMKTTEIPADSGSYATFAVLRDLAAERTRAILEDAAKTEAAAGTNARKIGDYYASFMDEAAIEAAGAAPLKPELAAIAAIKTRADLSRELGATLRADVDALNMTDYTTDRLFGLWVAEDMNDTSKYRPYIMQGGLGLPDRAYYLDDSARFQDLRSKYKAHIAAMFALAGYSDGEARAARILALETAIAKTHLSVDETGDVAKANNVWIRADLQKKAPGIDWSAWLQGAGMSEQPTFGAGSPAPSPASPNWSAASQSRPGRTIWRSTPSNAARPISPRRSPTNTSRSMARRWPARRSSAIAGSAGWTTPTPPWATRWGSSMSSATSPRRPRRRCRRW